MGRGGPTISVCEEINAEIIKLIRIVPFQGAEAKSGIDGQDVFYYATRAALFPLTGR